MQITIFEEYLTLTPEKIIYLENEQTIFLADAHLGKSTHFRKAGIAIPEKLILSEIDRLRQLISKYHPKRMIFLGDLFHSQFNEEWTIFTALLGEFPSVAFKLIKGNHDILPAESYAIPNLSCEEEPYLFKNFLLSHHPLTREELDKNGNILNLAGHIHPGITLNGRAGNNLRLPCYHMKPNQIILPAFGRFTGLVKISPVGADRVFALVNSDVMEIKGKWS